MNTNPTPEQIEEAFEEIRGDHDWSHGILETAYHAAVADLKSLKREMFSRNKEVASIQLRLAEVEKERDAQVERCLKHEDHKHCVTPCDSIRIQDSNHSAWLEEKERADKYEIEIAKIKEIKDAGWFVREAKEWAVKYDGMDLKLAHAASILKAKDEALIEYGVHSSQCVCVEGGIEHSSDCENCDCGLREALALRLDGEGK